MQVPLLSEFQSDHELLLPSVLSFFLEGNTQNDGFFLEGSTQNVTSRFTGTIKHLFLF
jgi:hypothetical protein